MSGTILDAATLDAMPSPNSQELDAMLDLTLPERSDRQEGNPCVLGTHAPVMVELPLFHNLETAIQACLPWYGRSGEFGRTTRWAQAIVAAIAVLALTGCLFFGASRAIFCWWIVATLGLIWALAIDDDRSRGIGEKKESVKETAVLAVLLLQFVSIAAIWTVFVMVRLK